jgi:hypothetical protein
MMKKIFLKTVMFAVFSNVYFACSGQTMKPLATDNAMEEFFGDKVSAIVASPSKVNAYILSMEKPTEKSKTIGGFLVKKKLGKVQATNYAILQFLMQDEANYQADSAGIRKCYFEPYLAFEFVKGKETTVVLFAFNCECWGVVYNDKSIEKPYLCHRQLLRFAKELLPDDKYINKLLTIREEKK